MGQLANPGLSGKWLLKHCVETGLTWTNRGIIICQLNKY